MTRFTSLAIANPDDLRFGVAPKPLATRRGMVIGGGQIYPELNFTLPPMFVEEATMPEIRRQYHEIISDAGRRAVELSIPGLVVEFETLPPMTQNPAWGIELTKILSDELDAVYQKHGLKSTLRITPNDTREFERPPILRSGHYWKEMLQTFAGCAAAGAELLSIESVGGKEVHDDALQMCDLQAVIFALCIMGARDMRFLWSNLEPIAKEYKVHLAGDSACGFGNTAMVLAEGKMIPRVFAAVDRAITAVRSLVAFECGAVGPSKDCAYENPILKAITGFPMAMEGKTAACAHFSPVGNIAAATCDTWSNESVQNVKLLSGMAPTVSLEQLAYDCRLFNQALADGRSAALQLRRWLVNSDAALDPQAYILTPENSVTLARAIVSAPTPYLAGRAVAACAIDMLTQGHKNGQVKIDEREIGWLDTMRDSVEAMPDDEDQFIAQVVPLLDASKYLPQEYDLPV